MTETKNLHPNYWIFQANPDRYDIVEGIEKEKITDYQVSRFRDEYRVGDIVWLWRSGEERGFYGKGRILDLPYQRVDESWVIDLEYEGLFAEPILVSELAKDPILADLLIIHNPRGTNFSLSQEEASRLEEIAPAFIESTGTTDARSNKKHSPYTAKVLIEKLLSDEMIRPKLLEFYVEAIKYANSFGSDQWGVTLGSDRIRLNVGNQVVATIWGENRLWVAIDLSVLNKEEIDQIESIVDLDEWGGKTVENSKGLYLNLDNYELINEFVARANKNLIKEVANKFSSVRSNVKEANAPGVPRYLRFALNDDSIPEPIYPTLMKVWWVNQGSSYEGEKKHGVLWAPLKGKGGRSYIHWENMEKVSVNDIVIHYAHTYVQAVSKVKKRFVESQRPGELASDDWEKMGRLIEVDIYELQTPISWKLIGNRIKSLHQPNSLVNESGIVKQGYLWPFSFEGLKILIDVVDQAWPDWIMNLRPEDFEDYTYGEERQMTKLLALQDFYRKAGLYFTPLQLASFYTSLQTKGFVILSGISGTGKTKLAQHFATLFPQPILETEIRDELIQLSVQPYMLKYNRMILPKQSTRLFEPPAAGEKIEVIVEFGDQQQKCWLKHASYTNSDYISLFLRGNARVWFGENFEEEDPVYLEPFFDEDELLGFRLFNQNDMEIQTTNERENTGRNWLFISVRPDWRDSKSLLGYYNPLTETYSWTDFLRFLVRATNNYKSQRPIPWFVILDEMNLARVEYYFADLLSVLESGFDVEGYSKEALRLQYPEDVEGDLPPKLLKLPPNLYVIGTVNIDETTHAFSPKVLDRAFSLELNTADFSNYLSVVTKSEENNLEEFEELLIDFSRDGKFSVINKESVFTYTDQYSDQFEWITNLNNILMPFDMHFGYRIFDEIFAYCNLAEENGLFQDLSDLTAFDSAVLMKVLPKFHGPRGKLEEPLKHILAWAIDPDDPDIEQINEATKSFDRPSDVLHDLNSIGYRLPLTAGRVIRMMWQIYTSGFASFG